MNHPGGDHELRQRQALVDLLGCNGDEAKLFIKWPTDSQSAWKRLRLLAANTNAEIRTNEATEQSVIVMRDSNGYADTRLLVEASVVNFDAARLKAMLQAHFKSSQMNPGMPFGITPIDDIDHLMINPITRWAIEHDAEKRQPREIIIKGLRDQYAKGSNTNRQWRAVNGEFTVSRSISIIASIKHNTLHLKQASMAEILLDQIVGRRARAVIDHPAFDHPEVTIKRAVNTGKGVEKTLTVEFYYPLERVGDVYPRVDL